jgi:Zn-finger protein
MISYDLIKRKDYPELHKAIRAYGPIWHCLDSTWIIKTDQTATQIRDALIKHIDSDDKLIVNLLQREAAWTTSFSKECQDWLRNNL